MSKQRSHRPTTIQRRDDILAAAADLVVERGAAGVTHRAVAERAGVPLSTTSYFFSSLDELVREAILRSSRQWATRLEQFAVTMTDGGTEPAEVVRQFAETLLSLRPAAAVAQFELYLAAVRDPELQDAVRDVVHGYDHVAEVAMRAAGGDVFPGAPRMFVALVDGMTISHLVDPRPDDVEVLLQAFLTLLAGGRVA